LATGKKFIFRVDHFDFAQGICPDKVFHHDHVTGLRHTKVRFGRDNQPERLQVCRHIQLATGSIKNHFTKIGRPAFRSNSPHDVGQKLRAESGGRLQFVEFDFDLNIALLAFHFRFAPRFRKQWRPAKINFCRAIAVLIVDSFCSSVHDIDGDRVYRLLVFLLHLRCDGWRGNG